MERFIIFMRLQYLSHCYDQLSAYFEFMSGSLKALNAKIGIGKILGGASSLAEHASKAEPLPSTKTTIKALREMRRFKVNIEDEYRDLRTKTKEKEKSQ